MNRPESLRSILNDHRSYTESPYGSESPSRPFSSPRHALSSSPFSREEPPIDPRVYKTLHKLVRRSVCNKQNEPNQISQQEQQKKVEQLTEKYARMLSRYQTNHQQVDQEDCTNRSLSFIVKPSRRLFKTKTMWLI
ncbi:hypothetical protein CLU79DRAFT_141229 [Phycomyces nitens]|nr:hypothetical protein CLU79DRAFT_141229 [Phycomyces nitens]